MTPAQSKLWNRLPQKFSLFEDHSMKGSPTEVYDADGNHLFSFDQCDTAAFRALYAVARVLESVPGPPSGPPCITIRCYRKL